MRFNSTLVIHIRADTNMWVVSWAASGIFGVPSSLLDIFTPDDNGGKLLLLELVGTFLGGEALLR